MIACVFVRQTRSTDGDEMIIILPPRDDARHENKTGPMVYVWCLPKRRIGPSP